MRGLTRMFGLSIIFLLLIMIFSQLMVYNVKKDEVVTNVTTASSTTQYAIQEQIEDKIYGTHNARKTINSNQEYLEDFKNNLDKLMSDGSKYEIKVYGIDYEKGLLDVEVISSFKMLNGKVTTVSSRKTSIVDVVEPI